MYRKVTYCVVAMIVLLATVNLPIPISHAVSANIVISEFRTRGPAGENDEFIELYNRSETEVNLNGWRISANVTIGTIATRAVIPNVTLAPGAHYLITGLAYSGAVKGDQSYTPGIPDGTGIAVFDPLGTRVDAVATFFGLYEEGSPLRGLVTNADQGYERKPGGVLGSGQDTDRNDQDFRLISPSDPQNLNFIQLSGMGNPSTVSPGAAVLLSVNVLPGKNPPSTGLQVVGDLTPIGGTSPQTFYDDGTHGDALAADNVFSFQTSVPATIPLGRQTLSLFISDAQQRVRGVSIVLDIESKPTCAIERSNVKTGMDSDAGLVDLLVQPTPVTIALMLSWNSPVALPSNSRIAPYETTRWVLNAILTEYKKDEESDYYLILKDNAGLTFVAEIPCTCCVNSSSPFAEQISKARAKFDGRLTVSDIFQAANIPILLTGVGLFDAQNGLPGAAPNGIELHPVLDLKFDVDLERPEIFSARISGKKLLVFGLNFEGGSFLLINGEKQKSAIDDTSSGTILIAKKAGKNIQQGQTITLQVRNPNGKTSDEVPFTRLN